MNGLRETCHCGHDKASHYIERAVRQPQILDCLCQGCDCHRYADANGPKPVKRLTRPNHPLVCRCYRCKEYLVQQAPPVPDTLPSLDDGDGY